MSFGNQAIVDSHSLQTLQADLRRLADSLHECYDLLCADLTRLSEHWQDDKYDEFEQDFRSRRDRIEEIAVRYRHWADHELQRKVEEVQAIEGSGVTI